MGKVVCEYDAITTLKERAERDNGVAQRLHPVRCAAGSLGHFPFSPVGERHPDRLEKADSRVGAVSLLFYCRYVSIPSPRRTIYEHLHPLRYAHILSPNIVGPSESMLRLALTLGLLAVATVYANDGIPENYCESAWKDPYLSTSERARSARSARCFWSS